MAKFRVQTELAIDKAAAAGAKVAMEGLTKAAMQLGGALVGGKAFVAPFKAMTAVIEDSIKASEKATAAQARMGEAVKNVYKTIGDEMTPGLNQLAESIQKALNNPEIIAGLQTTGRLLSVMATGISAVVDEIAGFVGSPAFAKWLQFFYGVDLNSEAMQAYREHGALVDQITGAVAKWAKGVDEQKKAEDKAAEARKKAHQEHLKNLQAILDKVNPIGKAEREAWQEILTLNQALRAGEIDVNTYQEALVFLTAELKKVQEAGELVAYTIANIDMPSRLDNVETIGDNPFAGGSMTVSQSPYVEEMMRAEEQFSENLAQGMGNAAASFAREFLETGEFSIEKLGDMLLDVLLDAAMQYFAQMVTNQAKLKMTSGANGESASGGGDMISAYMAGIAVVAMAITNYVNHKKAQAAMEWSHTPAPVGIEGGRVTTPDMSAMNDMERSVVAAVQSFLAAFQGVTGDFTSSLTAFGVEVRKDGKAFMATLNGKDIAEFAFETLDEAIMAGLKAALEGSDFAAAMDPVMRQIVENWSGTADDLIAAMTMVGDITDDLSGLSEIELAIRDLPGQAKQLANNLVNLGVSIDDAGVLAAKWSVQQMQDLRDQITGHQKSAEEQLAQKQREAAMFNAQLALDKAKIAAERANLQNQIAIETAKVQVMTAGAQASIDILNATLAAYDQVAAALEALPPIALSEIRLPGSGRGGGRGGGRNTPTGPTAEEIAAEAARAVADFNREMTDLARSIIPGVSGQIRQLNAWYAEQAARAAELGIPLGQLNQIYAQQFLNLQNEVLDSLGLQSIATVRQFQALAEALKYLREWGMLTEAQLRELGDSMYISLVDSLLRYVDNEEVRAQLEDLRFRMEMANYELQFQMLIRLGLLTQAEIDVIQGLLAGINEAYLAGELDFQMPERRRDRPNRPQDNRDEARERALDALRQALDRLRSAVEGLREFQEGLTLSSASPLTTNQQFDEAARRYAELLARAQAGDVGAMEELAAAAQLYLDLAAQMYGTSGAGYAAIFDLVSQQIAAIVAAGQAILDAAPAQMQGTEDRLDTTNQILAEIRRLFGGRSPGQAAANLPTAGNAGNFRSLGSSGNLSMGNFSSPGTLTVRDPELVAQVRALAEAQTAATAEAKADRMKKPAVGLSGFYGTPIGGRRSA